MDFGECCFLVIALMVNLDGSIGAVMGKGYLAPFVHLGAHKAHPCDVSSMGYIGHRTSPKSDGRSP